MITVKEEARLFDCIPVLEAAVNIIYFTNLNSCSQLFGSKKSALPTGDVCFTKSSNALYGVSVPNLLSDHFSSFELHNTHPSTITFIGFDDSDKNEQLL